MLTLLDDLLFALDDVELGRIDMRNEKQTGWIYVGRLVPTRDVQAAYCAVKTLPVRMVDIRTRVLKGMLPIDAAQAIDDYCRLAAGLIQQWEILDNAVNEVVAVNNENLPIAMDVQIQPVLTKGWEVYLCEWTVKGGNDLDWFKPDRALLMVCGPNKN